VRKAREVLDAYGESKAIVLARLVPAVRTYLNPLIGTVGVPLRVFILWNAVGALLWAPEWSCSATTSDRSTSSARTLRSWPPSSS